MEQPLRGGEAAGKSEALVIAARYPRVGRVKTRLARGIGAEAACRLYRAFLHDLQGRFGAGERPLFWAYTPRDCDFPALIAPAGRCFPQEGRNLAQRMRRIFERMFAAGYARVALMGSDLPHMPAELVERAFAGLASADAVFVPAEDGGYSLVALRGPHDLFSGVRVSTPRVMEQTLARARALGLTTHLLPPVFDVDEPADLERLRRALAAGDLSLPQTERVLAELQRLTPGRSLPSRGESATLET